MPKPKHLHHGTSIHCLLSILEDGAMRIDLGADEHAPGVSTSTSIGVARQFAMQAEEYAEYAEGHPRPGDGPCRGVVLAFDRRALERVSTLRPVRWDGVSTEREVRVLQPFRTEGALVSFEVGDAALAWYAHLAEEMGFDETRRAALAGLSTHPLRRSPPGPDAPHPIPPAGPVPG